MGREGFVVVKPVSKVAITASRINVCQCDPCIYGSRVSESTNAATDILQYKYVAVQSIIIKETSINLKLIVLAAMVL